MTIQTEPRPRAPAARRIDVELLTTPEQFAALQRDWTELARLGPANVFLTWEWIATWWEVFGAGLRPWILVGRDGQGGDLLGVAPFVLRRHPLRWGPCRELSLLGASMASGDHLDMLSKAGCQPALAERFADVLEAHRGDWDVLALDRLAADSPLAARLGGARRLPVMAWHTVCPYLALTGPSAPPPMLLSKKARRDLNTRVRQLRRDAGPPVECLQVRSADDLPAALEDLFRLHQPAGTDGGRRGAFRSDLLRRFHRLLAERFLARDWLRLYLLRTGSQSIAAWYGFCYRDRLSLFQTGFDRAWSRYAPGMQLLAHLLAEANAQGVGEVDFLRGPHPYKFTWTRTARRDLRLRIATTLRGAGLVLAYRAAYAMRGKFHNWRRGETAEGPPSVNIGEFS